MKKSIVAVVLCVAVLALATPAYASQGGISDGVMQLSGGNFMKPPANIRLSGDDVSGRIWAGLTYCQGYIGYKIDLAGAEGVDAVELWDGDTMVAEDDGVVARGRRRG